MNYGPLNTDGTKVLSIVDENAEAIGIISATDYRAIRAEIDSHRVAMWLDQLTNIIAGTARFVGSCLRNSMLASFVIMAGLLWLPEGATGLIAPTSADGLISTLDDVFRWSLLLGVGMAAARMMFWPESLGLRSSWAIAEDARLRWHLPREAIQHALGRLRVVGADRLTKSHAAVLSLHGRLPRESDRTGSA